MNWQSSQDAMSWVGLLSVAAASLICILLMAVDVFQGFQHRKLWFPCRFFTINATSITLIATAIAMKILTTDIPNYDHSSWFVMSTGIIFLFTMLANFLPSLGSMDDKKLFTNIIALGILIVIVTVSTCIKNVFSASFTFLVAKMAVMAFFLLWPFWVALAIPTSRRVLQHQYQELHKSTIETNFSSEELMRHVKKYWIMAETGNPQFVMASSPFSSTSGLACTFFATTSISHLIAKGYMKSHNWEGRSNDRWLISGILTMQSIGIVVGSIAPIFRSITTATYFNPSILNMFRVGKHWTERLQQWKDIQVTSHIPGGRHCKNVVNHIKNMMLNFCIAFQIMLVVICKTASLIPTCITLLFYSCCHFFNTLLKRFKKDSGASNDNVGSEIEEYIGYVLQIEDEAKLTNRALRNMFGSITKLLHESEKNQPTNLVKFLEKSTGFTGVVEFNNDQVPRLHPEEPHTCWSLVIVTLTTIALALPNVANGQVKGLRVSMSEGLKFVKHIEETLNANGDLVKARNTGRRVWTEVEVHSTWLQMDLQKMARKGKMSKEILQWLGDEAVKIVTHEFKRSKNTSVDDSLHNFIAANSMYRISQTILLHCNEQENWPTDVKLFEWISTIIADLLWACFTNLPRVIILKCHHEAIEKRGESIRTAARLLGKSKKILTILEQRQLPRLDMESMAYIDKWHALPKSQIPNVPASSVGIRSPSLIGIRSPSSRPNKAVRVTIR